MNRQAPLIGFKKPRTKSDGLNNLHILPNFGRMESFELRISDEFEEEEHRPPSGTHQGTSNAFPPGQGDITLVTVDDITFHVHRAVLRHSSSVLETIFDKGDGEGDGGSLPSLKIEASASTLEHLLALAYPNKPSPDFQELGLLTDVFRAAKRYEMEGVLQQLRRSLLEPRVINESIVQPMYITAPLATLVLCCAFDGAMEGRFALRECLRGDLEEHIVGAADFDIPAELLSTILRMRRERLDWFKGKLDSVKWIHNSCYFCGRKQEEWSTRVLRMLNPQLCFEKARTALYTPISCMSGHNTPVPVTLGTLELWLAEATALETKLPVLPHLHR